MDLVSVIIPYFKKRNFVKEALISVINQSYKNLEVLIIYDDTNLNDFEFLQKLVKLDNGSYRSFVLLEYPIAQVYKAFINRVEENKNLKSTVSALKNTDVFKELEQYVAEFSGA